MKTITVTGNGLRFGIMYFSSQNFHENDKIKKKKNENRWNINFAPTRCDAKKLIPLTQSPKR